MEWILMLYLANGDAGAMIVPEDYCLAMEAGVEAGDTSLTIETLDSKVLIVKADCLGPVRARIAAVPPPSQ